MPSNARGFGVHVWMRKHERLCSSSFAAFFSCVSVFPLAIRHRAAAPTTNHRNCAPSVLYVCFFFFVCVELFCLIPSQLFSRSLPTVRALDLSDTRDFSRFHRFFRFRSPSSALPPFSPGASRNAPINRRSPPFHCVFNVTLIFSPLPNRSPPNFAERHPPIPRNRSSADLLPRMQSPFSFSLFYPAHVG